MSTTKADIAIFELIPNYKHGAGFVRTDTVGSANPVELLYPKNRVIQSESVKRMEKMVKGKKTAVNVPTRYIYNCLTTLKEEQDEQKVVPNPRTDKIIFKDGFLTVTREGAFVGLYDFLKEHAQNESNPDRLPNFKPIFREMRASENAQTVNASDFIVSEAVGYIRELVSEENGKYVYEEERIDALCKLFNVQGESTSLQVAALIAFAKQKPEYFLKEAKASEQTLVIEVTHMVKLGVIEFAGSAVVLKAKNQKLKELGSVKDEKAKIEALAAWLGTQDGAEVYALLKAELDAAKAEKLAKN